MTTFIDLSDVPVIDNHCHAVEAVQSADPVLWRARFTESPDPTIGAEHVHRTAFYQRRLRRAGTVYGLAFKPEDEILVHREKTGSAALAGSRCRDARSHELGSDPGYPGPV